LRPVRALVEHVQRILSPLGDRRVLPGAFGRAMRGIIKAQISAVVLIRPVLQRRGLGSGHVRLEPAQKHHAWPLPGAGVIGEVKLTGAVKALGLGHFIGLHCGRLWFTDRAGRGYLIVLAGRQPVRSYKANAF
jgi:hypothetical protein